jgi:hypothetical protein
MMENPTGTIAPTGVPVGTTAPTTGTTKVPGWPSGTDPIPLTTAPTGQSSSVHKWDIHKFRILKEEFEGTNLDKSANIHEEYDHLAYVAGTPMRDYLARLSILREQLESLGEPISDLAHAMRIIRALPETWEGVNQFLRATSVFYHSTSHLS